MEKNNRNIAIDILKGIGILLVILGHMKINETFRTFIFSFHMPLFFLVAGLFYHVKPIKESLQRDVKRLLIPYLFTAVIVSFIICFLHYQGISTIKGEILDILYCSGAPHHSKYLGDMPYIGAIWFLCALFWSKNIYNYVVVKSKYPLFFSVLISVTATLIDYYIVNLPFGILPGCSAMIFIALGQHLPRIIDSKSKVTLLTICWLISIFTSRILMVSCDYGCYPVDVLGAVGGTCFFLKISELIDKYAHRYCSEYLSWLGRNSLPILCLHLIEMNIPGWSILFINVGVAYYFLANVFLYSSFVYLLGKVKCLRLIFGIQ